MDESKYFGFNATDRHLIEQTAQDIQSIKEEISALSVNMQNNQYVLNSHADIMNQIKKKENTHTISIIVLTILLVLAYGTTSLPTLITIFRSVII